VSCLTASPSKEIILHDVHVWSSGRIGGSDFLGLDNSIPLEEPIGLPTFHDLNLEDRVYRWMRLSRRSYNGPALELKLCGKKRIGRAPKWWDEEDEPYYQEILGAIHSNSPKDQLGTTWLVWELKNGVAPGEPFLVQINQPTYWCEESEPEWHGGIVKRLRRSSASSLTSWSRFLSDIEKSRNLRKIDTRAMKLDFWHHHRDIQVRLTSKHGGPCLLMPAAKPKRAAFEPCLR
jgi:hypothetical protein